MDIFDAYLSVPIVAICFVVGYVIKNSTIFGKIANQNIPLIVTVVGAIFGLLIIGLSPEAFIIGAVSGLASTGIHQVHTQFSELKAYKEAADDEDVVEFEEPETGDGDE